MSADINPRSRFWREILDWVQTHREELKAYEKRYVPKSWDPKVRAGEVLENYVQYHMPFYQKLVDEGGVDLLRDELARVLTRWIVEVQDAGKFIYDSELEAKEAAAEYEEEYPDLIVMVYGE